MDSLLSYLLQSTVIYLLFFGFYLLLLKKETYYSINRIYLMLTGILCLLIPFLKFESPVNIGAKHTESIVYILNVNSTVSTAEAKFGFLDWIMILYLLGCSVFLTRFIVNLFRIFYLIVSKNKTEINGRKIILTDSTVSSYSFFGFIFLPKDKINESESHFLLAHEECHVSKWHSADLLVFGILNVVQWYNPFVFWGKKELIAQHEFSADSDLIAKGLDVIKYRNILFNHSLLSGGNSLTNNFNSLLRRRLEMIGVAKTKFTGKFKLIPVIPLFLIVAVYIGTINAKGSIKVTEMIKSSIDTEIEELITEPKKEKIQGKVIEKQRQELHAESENITKEIESGSDVDHVDNREAKSDNGIKDSPTSDLKETNTIDISERNPDSKESQSATKYTFVEQYPVFKGGDRKLKEYLSQNLEYPDFAKRAGVEGKVIISFVVSATGEITNVNVKKGLGAGCDEAAVRVIKEMPKWKPAKQNNIPVDTRIEIPLTFKIKD